MKIKYLFTCYECGVMWQGSDTKDKPKSEEHKKCSNSKICIRSTDRVQKVQENVYKPLDIWLRRQTDERRNWALYFSVWYQISYESTSNTRAYRRTIIAGVLSFVFSLRETEPVLLCWKSNSAHFFEFHFHCNYSYIERRIQQLYSAGFDIQPNDLKQIRCGRNTREITSATLISNYFLLKPWWRLLMNAWCNILLIRDFI